MVFSLKASQEMLMLSWMPCSGPSPNTMAGKAGPGGQALGGRPPLSSRGEPRPFLGPQASLGCGAWHETRAACTWSPSSTGMALASVRTGPGGCHLALLPPPFTTFPHLQFNPPCP